MAGDFLGDPDQAARLRLLRQREQTSSAVQVVPNEPPAALDDEYWEALYREAEQEHEAPSAPAAEETSSWLPVDLTAVLNGTDAPMVPTVGERADGQHLLYAGRVNGLYGESESGKTTFAATIAAQELAAGRSVCYIDLEDEPVSVVNRLLVVGADPNDVRARFHYIAPRAAVDPAGQRFITSLPDTCRLVVIDATTELLALLGLSSNDDTDIATMLDAVPRAIARSGPAVLLLDHLVKNRDAQGRYATGSQHKLSGITGAAYLLESINRFTVGRDGLSRLRVTKDRPGQVRAHCLPGKDGIDWAADLVVEHLTVRPTFTIAPPQRPASDQPPAPTALMQKISETLERVKKPLSKTAITERVQGRATSVREALAALVDAGHVEELSGDRGALLHRLIRPYPGGAEAAAPPRPTPSHPVPDGVHVTPSPVPSLEGRGRGRPPTPTNDPAVPDGVAFLDQH